MVSQFVSPNNISLPIQTPSNIQLEPFTMQFPKMHTPTFNSFPILLTHQYLLSHSIPQKLPVSTTHHEAPKHALSYSQLVPISCNRNISHIPYNLTVTSPQHHSQYCSLLCTLLHSRVSHFFSPTIISLPIQTNSNIETAPLTMQLLTMHCIAVNDFRFPKTQSSHPSLSNPQLHPVRTTHHEATEYAFSYSQLFPNSPRPRIPLIPFKPPVTSSQQHYSSSSTQCTLLNSNVSQFHSLTNNSFPFNPTVTSSLQHSPCSSQLCTLLH